MQLCRPIAFTAEQKPRLGQFRAELLTLLTSKLGSVLTGFGLGVIEGLTKVYWPEASATVIFVIMAIVLLTRPAGLFGRA